ncbi:CLUMA_CG012364, isoform A [Clunio marinus]|uniref:CLUMA_CG012364, isoform A n=1 Tax=Clunio marinus TaxID=568069 RepID=A0A1J1IKY0_9DIPT|nr:CLUMA_CG012364, isoform A [Clunio marinus]
MQQLQQRKITIMMIILNLFSHNFQRDSRVVGVWISYEGFIFRPCRLTHYPSPDLAKFSQN